MTRLSYQNFVWTSKLNGTKHYPNTICS
jgi:hypothetical protein